MADPYSGVAISGYNANPPDDDGSQTEANKVKWATIKSKITDPVKTRTDSMDTALTDAFAKVVGGSGVTSYSTSVTIAESDQGKLVRATVAGITLTTPDATDVDSPFVFAVLNDTSGDITLDGNGSQTIDGDASVTIPTGCGLFVFTDGTNWLTGGQNFPTPVVYPPIGQFSALVIKVTGNTGLTVAANAVTLTNGAGKTKTVAVASTVNMGTTGVDALIGGSGANGTITRSNFYHAWVIAKEDGTTKVVMCTSATADATFLAALANIDSGLYVYYGRYGEVRTASGSDQLLGTWQFGRKVRYKVGLAQCSALPIITSGSAGSVSSPTWVAQAITSFVPTTASFISLVLRISATSNNATMVAPNNSYGAYNSASNPPPMVLNCSGAILEESMSQDMMLESSNIYYASNASSGAVLFAAGWETNI